MCNWSTRIKGERERFRQIRKTLEQKKNVLQEIMTKYISNLISTHGYKKLQQTPRRVVKKETPKHITVILLNTKYNEKTLKNIQR